MKQLVDPLPVVLGNTTRFGARIADLHRFRTKVGVLLENFGGHVVNRRRRLG